MLTNFLQYISGNKVAILEAEKELRKVLAEKSLEQIGAFEELVSETAIKFINRVRKGKVQRRVPRAVDPNYKVVRKPGKRPIAARITPQERRKMALGKLKARSKVRAKRAKATRVRGRSMRIGKAAGLYRESFRMHLNELAIIKMQERGLI